MMTDEKFPVILYLNVKSVISLIVANENIAELEAIDNFYNSTTYALLSDEKTKYWWFSAEALYDDYVMRKAGESNE